MALDPNDGGVKSRKMWMAYVVMFLGTLGYYANARWPALTAAYAEYCMFLLVASGIYAGANAGVKWMAGKAAKKKAASTSTSTQSP